MTATTTPTGPTRLPTFESQLEEITAAERDDGWLSACLDAHRHLALNRQLIAAVAKLLRSIGDGPVVELCAGRGELARALAADGTAIVATDAHPPAGSAVQSATAEEALRRYRPAVVLGSFVPVDAGVDEAVTAFPSVRHYLALQAPIGGLPGSTWLWQTPGWDAVPRPEIGRWMLTRHDVWLPTPEGTILQHGEAWHFRRRKRGHH